MSPKSTIRTGVAMATAVAALAVVPGTASAAFDAGHAAQCQGAGSIAGVGASFQRDAQLAWGATLLAPNPGGPNATGFGYAASADGGCAAFRTTADGGSQRVTYEPKGSGDGRAAVGAINAGTAGSGVRNTTSAFGGADEPPTPTQLSAANGGPTSGTADDAVLHTIPVASSAIAVDVRLPDGCAVAQSVGARRISRAALAGAFSANASFDTWGEVLPSITGTGCAAKTFKRVVRLDSSGTTFGFKRYLTNIDATTYPSTLANTAWPADTGSTAVVRPASNGAGALLDTLNAQTTNGGIGYSDVATSRDKAFDWSGATDTSFWTTVQRSGGTVYTSPAVQNLTGATGANRGANCANVQYADTATGSLPATTQSWSNVDGTGTTADYPICALTYALAWQQPSQANVGIPTGQTPISQDQARAVKDYLGFDIQPGGGQSLLPAAGYQALPSTVRSVSQTGVGALDF